MQVPFLRRRMQKQVSGRALPYRRAVLRPLRLQQEASSEMNDEMICEADKLYMVFRKKMQDVYRKNHAPDPFGNSMIKEFNAWQGFLRNSLKLDVVDVESHSMWERIVDKEGNVTIKIPNPSNGAAHSNESILVPADLARKALALGDLPDEL